MSSHLFSTVSYVQRALKQPRIPLTSFINWWLWRLTPERTVFRAQWRWYDQTALLGEHWQVQTANENNPRTQYNNVNLGVIFSSGMTWTEHIDQISYKINRRLCLLKRIMHLLPQFARVLYFSSFVLPLFDYGDMIWGDKNNDTLM